MSDEAPLDRSESEALAAEATRGRHADRELSVVSAEQELMQESRRLPSRREIVERPGVPRALGLGR